MPPEGPQAPPHPEAHEAKTHPLSSPPRPSRVPALLLGAALCLHLSLILYFAPLDLLLSSEPVASVDYSLHLYQVDRARRAFESSGRLWSYDPQVLAGQPAGALEDLTSKGNELFVIALVRLGVPFGLAFNLFILLGHLLVPVCALLAGRLFGLPPLARALAVLFFSLLWFLDSLSHWFVYCGMMSWAMASCLAVLLVALAYRTVENGPAWRWVLVALLAAASTAVHPFSAFASAPACAACYLRRVRRLGPAHHVGLVLTLGLVLGTNALWLVPAARFAHYLLEVSNYFKPGFLQFIWDFFDITYNTYMTGAFPNRTLFRFICVGIGLWQLARFARMRDPRFLPLAVGSGVLLFLAYAGEQIHMVSKVQPYRMVLPAALLLCLPAALLLGEALNDLRITRLSFGARIVIFMLIIAVVPRAARTVFIQMPDLLPERPPMPPGWQDVDINRDPVTGRTLLVPPRVHRHERAPQPWTEVREWLQVHHRGRGRVLVQDWILHEHLAWTTSIPLLGGLEVRALHHADAHLFRFAPQGNLPSLLLRLYLERYAVGFVVVGSPLPALEGQADVLELRAVVGGYRIFRTRFQPDYLLQGRGRVARQDLNLIRVEGASGDDLVLRFHYMETLRCRPGCRVERFPLFGDRVGFIRVRRPPRVFEVYNSYEWTELPEAPKPGA